jgi:hypothetical protein
MNLAEQTDLVSVITALGGLVAVPGTPASVVVVSYNVPKVATQEYILKAMNVSVCVP